MRCFALLALASCALAATIPLERRRVGRKARPWVRKLLVVRSAEDAEPWAKYASKFRVSLNYDSKTHGDDQTRLLPDVEYAPMQQVDDDLATWTAHAEAAIANGAQYLLGLKCATVWLPCLSDSEPNEIGISGAAAAKAYRQAIQPLLRRFPHVKGVSPACSSNPNFVEVRAAHVRALADRRRSTRRSSRRARTARSTSSRRTSTTARIAQSPPASTSSSSTWTPFTPSSATIRSP